MSYHLTFTLLFITLYRLLQVNVTHPLVTHYLVYILFYTFIFLLICLFNLLGFMHVICTALITTLSVYVSFLCYKMVHGCFISKLCNVLLSIDVQFLCYLMVYYQQKFNFQITQCSTFWKIWFIFLT